MKKRMLAIVLAIALFIGMMPMNATVAVADSYATVTSSNGYGVRLREGPSTGYRAITTYNVGTTVTVMSQGGVWSKLQIGSTVGWMMSKFLIFGGTTGGGGGGSLVGVGSATVTSKNGKGVWLRTTKSGKRIGLYSVGTSVTLLEKGDTWCRISIGSNVGYMMTEFLNFSPVEPIAPVSTRISSAKLNYSVPVVGDLLEASIVPEGARADYVWVRINPVTNASQEVSNSETYKVTWSDIDQIIKLTLKGKDGFTGSASCSTKEIAGTRMVSAVSLNKPKPAVGDVLTPVVMPSSASVNCIWLVAGVVKGQTESYTVTENDVGKRIQLKVTGTGEFDGSAVCTADDDVVSDKQVISVTINIHDPLEGSTLTPIVVPNNAQVTYRWVCDQDVIGTGSSYKVTARELGKKITLTITGKDPYSGSASDTTNMITKARLESVTINNTEPLLNKIVYANIKPAGATADYTWYVGDVEQAVSGNAFDISKKEYIGKAIKVKAVGSGVYSGTVTSAATKAVVDDSKITSVMLSNMNPVAGDVLTAVFKPATIPANSVTYIWTVGTQTFSNTSATYTVTGGDIGKTIRVQANGTGDYVGTAKSEYTKAVIGSANIASVALTISNNGQNAASVAPEYSQTLVASVSPAGALVKYEWKVDGKVVNTANNQLKLDDASWKGEKVTLTVTGTGNYKGSKSVTSKAIANSTPLNEIVRIAQPVAGNKPATAVSVDKKYKGTIQWSPALDQFGNFKPLTTYRANVVISPVSGYTMTGAKMSIQGASGESKISGNTVSASFAQTGSQKINLYNIQGVSAPIAGEKPVSSITDTAQFSGSVKWNPETPTFEVGKNYDATITLTPKNGYVLQGLPANVFTVVGASNSGYAAGSATVSAKFSVAMPKVKVTTDTTNVLLDGKNSVSMPFKAALTNYQTDQTVTWKWSLTGAAYSSTNIDENSGVLSIAAKETTGKRLFITAKAYLDGAAWTVGGKAVQGELAIQLSPDDGSVVDPDAIRVEFLNTCSYVQAGGAAGEFSAIAHNTTQGVRWYLLGSAKDANGKAISTCVGGKLVVPASETARMLVVIATAKEDENVHAEFVVKVGTTATEPKVMNTMNSILVPGLIAPGDNAEVTDGMTTEELMDWIKHQEWVAQPDEEEPTAAPSESVQPEPTLTAAPSPTVAPSPTAAPSPSAEAPTDKPMQSESPKPSESPVVTPPPTQAPSESAPVETTELPPTESPSIEPSDAPTEPIEQEPETSAETGVKTNSESDPITEVTP
ncbi:MAG: SH3 domain-containing protein [Clostridiales bacterium]|nr:SH3 domain-containing protein [Clostridiales bacterium]